MSPPPITLSRGVFLAVIAVAISSLTGCGKLLGLDDYHSRGPDAGSRGGARDAGEHDAHATRPADAHLEPVDAVTPAERKPPARAEAGCDACSMASCANEPATCTAPAREHDAGARDASGRDAGEHDAHAIPGRADAGSLFVPKPPFLAAAACEACMTANCAPEATACAADEGCAAWLLDLQTNPDPVSAFTRNRQLTAALFNAEHQNDGGPVTLPQNAFHSCARARCTTECELGRDFSCFGAFEWPRSFPTETDIQFQLVDSNDRAVGLPGFQVRACLNAACAPPLAQGLTDAQGVARSTPGLDWLAVREKPVTAGSPYPEFNGFLLVDGGPADAQGGPAYYPLVIQYSRPWVAGAYQVGEVTKDVLAPYFQLLNQSYDTTLAYYFLQPFDCRGEPAKGVTAEFQVFDGTAYRSCDTCRIGYSNDANIVDPTLTAFSSLGVIAYVSAPVRQSILLLRDEKTRVVVAALTLFTLPGHFHLVVLYPPSTAQLADLPPSAR